MAKTKNHTLIEIEKNLETVFTVSELSQLFPESEPGALRRMLSYYVQRRLIHRIRHGIYAKEVYNAQELANKLYTPSYISFVTILEKEGVIFQSSSIIHSAAYLSRDITADNHSLAYHKVNAHILLNGQGIEQINGINRASLERAFLDQLYLFGDGFFDNLRPLDWEKIFLLLPLYERKTLVQRVNKQFKLFKEDHA